MRIHNLKHYFELDHNSGCFWACQQYQFYPEQKDFMMSIAIVVEAFAVVKVHKPYLK